jgi:hypothetical protein
MELHHNVFQSDILKYLYEEIVLFIVANQTHKETLKTNIYLFLF